MSLLQSPYVYLMLVAASVSLLVALLILSRHSAPGAVPLAILNLCGSVWALTTAFTLASPNYVTAVWWHKVQLLGMEPVSVAWIVFVLAYLGRDRWLRPGRLAAIGAVTTATILLGFTNEFHHLMWQQLTFVSGSPSVLRENPALWWWVATFYDYALLLLGIVLLAMTFWKQEGIYRRQTALVIVACLVPLSIDMVYTMTIGTKNEVNLSPLAFTFVGALLSLAFLRFKLFEVTPIARDFILENMTDALIVLDDRGRVTELNGAAETVLSTKASTAIGKQLHEVCKGVPELSELAAGWHATSAELLVGSGDEARTYHALVSAVPSKRGELKGKIVVLRDITELKQAEIAVREARDQLELRVQERTAELEVANEGLRRSQSQLAQLLSTSPATIYTGRPEPGFPLTFVSANAQTQLGLTSAELLAPSFWRDYVHPDDLQVLTAKESVFGSAGVAAHQYRLRCPAGERVIHDEMRLLRDRDGRPVEVVGSWVDVTERVQRDEELSQSAKMEAVGRLAGGIAHDFNNLLTAIIGYSDMLGLRLPDCGGDELREILRAAERAGALTKQLLAFSRRQLLQPQVIDVNEIVESTHDMLGRLIGEHIEFVIDISPDLGPIRVDPGQLSQVCMNLTINARDAMPEGGRLTLRTRSVVVSAEGGRAGLSPGEYVCLVVSDTGLGMDTESRDRLFEPFYTTKGDGGTGLGLATVYGIVSQSGGHIEVDSTPGRGSEFRVFLPVAAGQVERVKPPIGVPALQPPAAHKLIVVEDEPAVRALVVRALADRGNEVLSAANPQQALKHFADGARVDLVISDVIMPGKSGPQLVAELRTYQPELRVLYISGYPTGHLAQGATLETSEAFLEKPFTPAKLVAKVEELLTRGVLTRA